MKREIKFRAWDGIRFTPRWIMFYTSTGVLTTPNQAKIELMQFTGLTDKNGKEIYEHDILISKYGDKKPFEILFGEYQTYEEQAGGKSTSIGFYWNEADGEQVGFGKSIEGNMDAYEIIGNIYENPELL